MSAGRPLLRRCWLAAAFATCRRRRFGVWTHARAAAALRTRAAAFCNTTTLVCTAMRARRALIQRALLGGTKLQQAGAWWRDADRTCACLVAGGRCAVTHGPRTAGLGHATRLRLRQRQDVHARAALRTARSQRRVSRSAAHARGERVSSTVVRHYTQRRSICARRSAGRGAAAGQRRTASWCAALTPCRAAAACGCQRSSPACHVCVEGKVRRVVAAAGSQKAHPCFHRRAASSSFRPVPCCCCRAPRPRSRGLAPRARRAPRARARRTRPERRPRR